ncbi:calcium-activated chloride channel regulator 1-like [Eleutherodactylus coqui]|uniref:calcium-activated chloride channel regulator 1-like n=1 Tax=Eleutherodactylus coqui TaxID=57060 RepID=UPI0034621957
MTPKSIFALVLVIHIFAKSESSMVKLTNGGYDDIVIAVNPNVQEDLKIIEKIKEMVKEATSFLFDATGKRLYIKSVKILLPKSWTANNYGRPKTETYDKADIIIDSPNLKYGDEPYTQQYGQCGDPGQFIHLTQKFVTDDSVIQTYGPRGRVFVHEWAHLRWGVFDEYNLDKPFYISENGKVEATRCSADIEGAYRIRRCQGTLSCKIDNCKIDPNTGLYEEGCLFVPKQFQTVTASLMYMQSIPPVINFCNDSNHNIEASNLQNEKCNFRSTWDVIASSADIKSTQPSPGLTIPDPTVTVLQFSDRVITLVMDVSGSMATSNRIGRLYQAADVFLMQIIEIDSHVGMVTFSSSASTISSLVQIKSDVQRQNLRKLLPTVASGGTNICSGLQAGIQVNLQSGSSDGTEVLLLSDGEDNFDTNLCAQKIIQSGAIIHVIFLGTAEEPKLKEIAKATGGTIYLATDKVDNNGLINAFSAVSANDGDITKQSIQLESTALSLQPAGCLNGTVFIDTTVGNETFFLVTWQTTVPNINLQDPKGKTYTSAEFVSDNTAKSSRLAIPGTAERGPWNYNLCNSRTSAEILGLVVNSKASDANVPPIVVNAHMNQDTNQYPNPMVIYASVSQGLIPVSGAKVTANVEPVTGSIETLELLDNGAGPDLIKNDGIYSRYFTQFSANGRYGLKVRVENNNKAKSRLVLPKNRALYIPGYIINDTVTLNPPRPEIPDEGLTVGEFSRTASGGSFVVSNVPAAGTPPQDIYKPDKISDLAANIVKDTILLSWTATGDDLDQGTASSYDLRMNINPSDLRTNFSGSTPINITALSPSPAGSTETFSFVPENIVIKNGTILYFALVAIDKVSQQSDVSNIAQAALIIPPTPAPTPEPATTVTRRKTDPTTKGSSNGLNPTVITLIVCIAVIII